MVWLELLQLIKRVIEESEFDTRVELGFLAPQNAGIDSRGLVLLGRGEATPSDRHVQNEYKQEFYIEVWGKSPNNKLDEAYEIIAELERKLEAVMIRFRKACGELDDVCVLQNSGYQIIDFRVTNKVDDNESMRPIVGTQYRFEAILFDLKEDTNGGIY